MIGVGRVEINGFDVSSQPLNHPGGSFAYRIRGTSGDLVYATDHEFGNADIDLSVEEPPGTICSVAEPRTSGGGVRLGDAFSAGGDIPEFTRSVYAGPDVAVRDFVRRGDGRFIVSVAGARSRIPGVPQPYHSVACALAARGGRGGRFGRLR